MSASNNSRKMDPKKDTDTEKKMRADKARIKGNKVKGWL